MTSRDSPDTDPKPHEPGQTTPELQGDVAPRMPHERDESSDSQKTKAPQPALAQAYSDVASGSADTDRGPVLDKVYETRVRPENEATANRGSPAETSHADLATSPDAPPANESRAPSEVLKTAYVWAEGHAISEAPRLRVGEQLSKDLGRGDQTFELHRLSASQSPIQWLIDVALKATPELLESRVAAVLKGRSDGESS